MTKRNPGWAERTDGLSPHSALLHAGYGVLRSRVAGIFCVGALARTGFPDIRKKRPVLAVITQD
jgi:hypothetical protein